MLADPRGRDYMMRLIMSLLQVADIAFGYGAERLFQGVTFRLNQGQRAALVAPNGAGKTTLLRILAGELVPDEGSVVLDKLASLAMYRQSHERRPCGTVLDTMLADFQDVLEIRGSLEKARSEAASGRPEDLRRLAYEEERYQLVRGDELEHRVQMIAQRLGFDKDELLRPVESLSGGERGRLYLGTALAQQPSVLLLDEPTNHLDLTTIAWLETHLVQYPGAVLVVSHDREFLDNVCPITFELGHRSFRTYHMGYTAYHDARELDLQRERAQQQRQQAMIAKTEDFIRKNIAGQKTKQAQSRRKMLEKLDKLDVPEDTWQTASHVSFRFCPAPRSGDMVLEAKGLGATRGGHVLFEKLDLLVRRGDRLAIVGPNGCGKTTLLNLLFGSGDPADQGWVRRGANVLDGYFDQHLGSLKLDHSAIEEIRSVRGDMNVDATRGYLARFRFWGDQPFARVASMSGGERSRLALAKLLLEPRNLLLLDEPTNHLDIPAAEILEQALIHFDGTVVFVSHDRRFLRNVSTRVIRFGPEGVQVFETPFAQLVGERGVAKAPDTSWLEAVSDEEGEDAFDAEDRLGGSDADFAAKGGSEQGTSASEAKARFEATKAAARALQRKQRRLVELEGNIAQIEEQIAQVRAKLSDAAVASSTSENWQQLSDWAVKEQALCRTLDELMNEWSELGQQLATP